MDKIREVFEGNVIGPMRLTQEVIPGMKERRNGRIIFIGAGMGIVGMASTERSS